MNGANILVVDDNALNRKIIATIALHQGHTVEQAAGGAEALLRLGQGGIDVVLLDLVMPEMDGFEVLRLMREDARLRHVPVIVISGMEGMENVIRSLEMGAADYLPKPVDPVLLKARLNATLNEKRLRDVERKHLVEVRGIQARLSAVIDNSPMGIVLIDMEGKVIEANPTFHRLLRSEGEKLGGLGMTEFCGESCNCVEEMQAFLRGGVGLFCQETVMRRRDDTIFNVRLTMSMVPGEGDGHFAVAMVEDVTERTNAVTALRQNEESLRKVFEGAPFPLIIAESASGKVIDMNQKAVQVFEFDREVILGKNLVEFYQDAEDRRKVVELTQRNGFVENMELLFRTRTGKNRWLVISARNATLGGIPCILSAAFD
ncbi:MAG: response regulator, partial [Methanomassiliicoccales archaeon]